MYIRRSGARRQARWGLRSEWQAGLRVHAFALTSSGQVPRLSDVSQVGGQYESEGQFRGSVTKPALTA